MMNIRMIEQKDSSGETICNVYRDRREEEGKAAIDRKWSLASAKSTYFRLRKERWTMQSQNHAYRGALAKAGVEHTPKSAVDVASFQEYACSSAGEHWYRC